MLPSKVQPVIVGLLAAFTIAPPPVVASSAAVLPVNRQSVMIASLRSRLQIAPA